MNQHQWITEGIRNGWCSPPVCVIHDGYPTTLEEDELFEQGGDPCIHVIRPYHDTIEKSQVEENFSPAEWRKGPYDWEIL